MLLYVTNTCRIYQSTTVSRLRSNASQGSLFSALFFEANPSSKLKALMRQVQKQQQVKLQYFRLYQIEKTTRQKQLLAQSYNFNSRRANCERYTKLKLLLELFLMIIYHTSIQEQISDMLCFGLHLSQGRPVPCRARIWWICAVPNISVPCPYDPCCAKYFRDVPCLAPGSWYQKNKKRKV